MTRNILRLVVLTITTGLPPQLFAQVQTEVPAVVPNAKPVTVERIKIHGPALQGNLEKNAVERDVFVFLPPSYGKEKVDDTRSSTRFTATRLALNNGPRDPRSANNRRSVRTGR